MTGRYRALGFLHPDLVDDQSRAGLQLAAQGGLATVTDGEAVRQALLLLLTTRPGERVGRPGYGCDLFRLVFSPLDDTSAGLAIHFVRQALARWEPRVEVLALDASPAVLDRAPHAGMQLVLRLDYRLRATGGTDALTLAVPLAGGTA